jgi:butyryl-CoA dehydrogenase
MDFELNENQKMFRDMVRDFTRQHIAPIAHEMDVKGDMPDTLIAALREGGFFGLTFPERYGGLGVDTLTYGLVVEELSKASAGVSVMLTVHNSVGSYPVALYGSDELKQEFLPRMAAGEIAAFCVTEAGAGSDASALQATARRDGDHYVLNGAKSFVTNGARAAFYVILAREPGTTGHKGTHAFLVERDTPGLSVAKKEDKMGLRASDTTDLNFDNCRVPARNLLGQLGEGFKLAMTALDGGRIGIAAQSIGVAQAALDAAIRYAQQRSQFGQKIAKFQGLRWMIADMATELEAARQLTMSAAAMKDQKAKFTRQASMAKLFASEMVNRVTANAVQIHGGYGFTKDYEVERYYRDARVFTIYEGTSEIQRVVISNHLLRDRRAP